MRIAVQRGRLSAQIYMVGPSWRAKDCDFSHNFETFIEMIKKTTGQL